MPQSYVIIRDGPEKHRLDITHRDWNLLAGPFFAEGRPFIDALGVFEHFTVAGGIPVGSQVKRQRFLLVAASEALYRAFERDADILSYDYSYSFTTEAKQRNSGEEIGFHVRGFRAHISARPHGYCCLRLSQLGANGLPRVIEFIDMRVRKCIQTDDRGVLRIHRRRAAMHWLERLPQLVEFLRSRRGREITIEHYERSH